MSTEIKYIQHTDDLTLAAESIQLLEKALINIYNFCDHAGSKINHWMKNTVTAKPKHCLNYIETWS